MAYEKHTWECGEAITTEKLNHIEEGIANAGEGGYECEGEIIAEAETLTATRVYG